MLLVGGWGSWLYVQGGTGLGGPRSDVQPRLGWGPCTMGSNAWWTMVTWGPHVDRMTDKHDWKHYLSATSLAGGKNSTYASYLTIPRIDRSKAPSPLLKPITLALTGAYTIAKAWPTKEASLCKFKTTQKNFIHLIVHCLLIDWKWNGLLW